MPDDCVPWTWWAVLAVYLAAAGYLLATGRRSWRAAALGLLGVGLLAEMQVEHIARVSRSKLFHELGAGNATGYLYLWGYAVQRALGYGLLIAAVLADRRK